MIFPRMLALAERAWHKADWEKISKDNDREAKWKEDWTDFANTLGYRELARLDAAEIYYRIPPPAATYGILILFNILAPLVIFIGWMLRVF